jgi:hypothetical protein
MEDKNELIEEIRALLEETLRPIREECRALNKKMSLMIIQQTGLGVNVGEMKPMVFDLIRDQNGIIGELRDIIKEQNAEIRNLYDTIVALTERIAILEGAANLDQD